MSDNTFLYKLNILRIHIQLCLVPKCHKEIRGIQKLLSDLLYQHAGRGQRRISSFNFGKQLEEKRKEGQANIHERFMNASDSHGMVFFGTQLKVNGN